VDELLATPDVKAAPILALLGVRGGWPTKMYRHLERGALEQPATDFLDDVALLLGMDEHARAILWREALGALPASPLRSEERAGALPDIQDTLDSLGELGQIAYTTDRSFRPVQWNRLAYEMFPAEFRVDGTLPANFMEYTLWASRDRFHIQWDTAWKPLALAMLRGRIQEHPTDTELQRLESRVLADPTVAPMYLDPALGQIVPDGRPQPMDHGTLGVGWAKLIFGRVPTATDHDFMIINFRSAADEDVDFTGSWEN
jgi:PAS domain-containing protein